MEKKAVYLSLCNISPFLFHEVKEKTKSIMNSLYYLPFFFIMQVYLNIWGSCLKEQILGGKKPVCGKISLSV